MLGGGHGLAHLTNLILILAHACLGGEFVQLVIGSGVIVRISETVGFTDLLDHAGNRRIGFTNHAHAHRAGLSADILLNASGSCAMSLVSMPVIAVISFTPARGPTQYSP